MSNTRLLEKIDAEITEKNLLKHPFYQDWRTGRLTRESLQLYAAQYYKHVAASLQHWEATGILRGIYPIIVRSCRGAKGRCGILTS